MPCSQEHSRYVHTLMRNLLRTSLLFPRSVILQRLMRVNHTGEVCAQALYNGQALTAHNAQIADALKQASAEETEHLAWCEKRIKDLGGRTSVLNPLWYAGSFALGALAGAIGDKWSLGFLAETEHQVGRHLQSHLAKLPPSDEKKPRIIQQMQLDEAQHAASATAQGGGDAAGTGAEGDADQFQSNDSNHLFTFNEKIRRVKKFIEMLAMLESAEHLQRLELADTDGNIERIENKPAHRARSRSIIIYGRNTGRSMRRRPRKAWPYMRSTPKMRRIIPANILISTACSKCWKTD